MFQTANQWLLTIINYPILVGLPFASPGHRFLDFQAIHGVDLSWPMMH
jgi:hypothetical protein